MLGETDLKSMFNQCSAALTDLALHFNLFHYLFDLP